MPDKEVMPVLTDEQVQAWFNKQPNPEDLRNSLPPWGLRPLAQRDADQKWHDNKCGSCRVLMNSFVKLINKLEAEVANARQRRRTR